VLNDPRVQPSIDKLPGPLPRWLRWMRKPNAKWVRIATGILFIIGSCLSILPIFGIWMLPLGMILLAQDIPLFQRLCSRLLDWVERRHPTWLAK
jgi:hypothetical protein